MENTKIEWCDHTFNPWVGCRKISAGCQNCYAETLSKRFGKKDWNDRVMTSEANWKKPLEWDKKAQKEGIRRKVFTGSMCDIFDKEVPDEWRHDLFDLIDQTNNLILLLLTKRPENASRFIYDYLSEFTPDSGIARNHESFLKKIWVGVTVENQAMAEKRIPILLQIPAAKRFLSCEPLLGEIDLKLDENGRHPDYDWGIDWVICGGESGHKARPINPEWVRSLRDQCVDASVSFFFKQWGEYKEVPYYADNIGNLVKFETAGLPTFMKKVGKKNAGRLLDGIEWNEVPK